MLDLRAAKGVETCEGKVRYIIERVLLWVARRTKERHDGLMAPMFLWCGVPFSGFGCCLCRRAVPFTFNCGGASLICLLDFVWKGSGRYVGVGLLWWGPVRGAELPMRSEKGPGTQGWGHGERQRMVSAV